MLENMGLIQNLFSRIQNTTSDSIGSGVITGSAN